MSTPRWFELAVLTPHPGAMHATLARLATTVAGPALVGCWYTVLGHRPRIHLLRTTSDATDHAAARQRIVANEDVLGVADLLHDASIDVYAPLPCMPAVDPAPGAIFEIRTYELHPQGALEAAIAGWAAVIDARLALAPVTMVMHALGGPVPRLVHIYPYASLAERAAIRDRATATGRWPPKGGAVRNRVMATEIALAAPFSPIRGSH